MIKQVASLFVILTFLTGFVYPLVVTVLCNFLVPYQSVGSLFEYRPGSRASILVGQSFTKETYFWGRPSVTAERPYNLMAGASSNLNPKSGALQEYKQKNKEALKERGQEEVTEDLVLASGSSLDPHITPEAAFAQVSRVAKSRSLDVKKVEQLASTMVESPWLRVFGEPRVNVSKLNAALDKE